jgi:chitinase
MSDARQTADHARTHGLGLLAMWSLGRDRPCQHLTATAQENCSGAAQSPYTFARAMSP